MPNPSTYVHPIHFEDFDGFQFERLVFAYHARAEPWQSLEWYGQVGSDLGRDLWGVRKDGESVCIQCVNRKRLTCAKVEDDLGKVLSAVHGVPDRFRIVGRGSISADMRDKIKGQVHAAGVKACDLWSGLESEEFLRLHAEPLLKRFVGGRSFPTANRNSSSWLWRIVRRATKKFLLLWSSYSTGLRSTHRSITKAICPISNKRSQIRFRR